MFAIFRRKFYKNWLMILGWGLGLGILGYYLFDIYNTFFDRNIDLMSVFNAFPDDLMAFFGGDVDLFSPAGFLHLEFFSYMPILLGIVVITSAAGLITKGEEDGTLEVVLAQPISRSSVFISRLSALILTVVIILVFIWVGFVIGVHFTDFELTMVELVRPLISLFAVLMMFMSLALFLSMVLPSSSSAGLVTGFFLIASYFISSLARIDDSLEGINRFSPLKYYQGGAAVNQLDAQNLLLLFGLAIIFNVLAWFFFDKRDLRFGGSGGLRLVFHHKTNDGG